MGIVYTPDISFALKLHLLCKSSNLVNGSTIYQTRATLEGQAI